ncbi:epidermal growth factor receptor substrate 15 isoform X1 [Clupea harengus]|uniref:Epidermal growth factor receptor substrate 15 isoform X1 n=1 Tax=Clupea harengus TaxID=7950 RepID=A0A6P8G3P6_CLUHA|nr:epidermal growth factor receptor substrate 15 isoform X1 [Clupea harengus]
MDSGNRNIMAASLSLSQLSSGNPVYDKYYRQVDPSGSGRVPAADAALFLKRSALADLVLGKIWDLADSERKGCLNKQQFFVALRLVACAQNGLEVALKSLNAAVPPPKFHDTSSPLLPAGVAVDGPWAVKGEEKVKFDAIFDSLSPAGGMLTGEKVKPVLLNSKLPVDVLGRVWELSDIDRDGMLDRDEFAVAMYLVYRALENETVPMSLPPALVPQSKRKKSATPPALPLLPSPPSLKEGRTSQATAKALPPAATTITAPQWVVSLADKAKYDDLFSKTDIDMDGLVSGPEVRDIFLRTGLPSATLARIWELCDIGDIGKLTREQFALALHLINQKLTKGVDPPQALTPDMIPPADRVSQSLAAACQAADFSAIKELDSLSNEIVDLQREKSSVEQEIHEKEESIRQRTSEVQDLQDEVQKETAELQTLQSQRQEVQEALDKLDVQKSSLEEQLGLIRQQCSQENQMILSLQAQLEEQEQQIGEYQEELGQAHTELQRLQEETQEVEQKVEAARAQLNPLQDSVQESHTQVSQAKEKLTELRMQERDVTAQLSWLSLTQDDPVPVPLLAPRLTHTPTPTPLVNGALGGRDGHLDQDEQEGRENGGADEPHELRVEEDEDEEEEEEEEEKEKEKEQEEEVKQEEVERPREQNRTKSPEKPRPDAMEDLYTSGRSTAWPQDNAEMSSPLPEAETEVKEEETAELQRASTPKQGESPVPEQAEGSSQPQAPGQGPAAPAAAPPAGPTQDTVSSLDFFQSDPFTDHDPFKDDPFSKVDVSDPFGGDPFKGSDPFAADSFFKQAPATAAPFPSADPFGSVDPFGGAGGAPEPDPFATQLNNTAAAPDPFGSQSSGATATATTAKDPFSSKANNISDADPFASKMAAHGDADPFSSQGGPDPFTSALPGTDGAMKDPSSATNDPFAPGGTVVNTDSDPDPFAAVFGNESFGGGFADFSALAKSNGADPFAAANTSTNKNLFKEDSQSSSSDTPPALPPKTGTPTRPPPPPPGKRSNIARSDSSDSFSRRGFMTQGDFASLPAKDSAPDPFAPSSPRQPPRQPEGFASFDKYPTEEDMIEWAKRESEREEKERLARLTQQEQEDLELAIALSKSELS